MNWLGNCAPQDHAASTLPASREVRGNKPLEKKTDARQQNRELPMTKLTRRTILAAAPGALALAAVPARADAKYGPGVTDTEIKIGNTSPYSGPLSNASPIPLSMEAYFNQRSRRRERAQDHLDLLR
jgi:hypothetical protein